MAFVDENKGEPHLIGLTKATRDNLKLYLEERIYENDNKEISATDVIESLIIMVDSAPNLLDDNLDLRAYKSEVFQLADCSYNATTKIYTYTLAETAKNPIDDSQFFIDGLVNAYGVDYVIAGTSLIFSIDDELEDTTILELEIKYRYFL